MYESEYSNKLVRCPLCGAGQQTAYLEAICGLPAELRGYTWTQNRGGALGAAHTAARRIVESGPAWFFTLTGPFGVGKTGTLAAIVNAGRAAGMTAVYTTTADMLDYLRAAYAPNAPLGYDGRMDLLTTCRILAIDEFDRWNPTPWAQEKFFQIIEARYANGMQQLTAFATNANLTDLPGYIVSRMNDRRCQIHALSGADLRPGRKS